MHRAYIRYGKKLQKLDFYADSVVLFARMKICFVRKIGGFYHKKIWRKTKLDEVLGPLNLSVGLQSISLSNQLENIASN